MSRSKLALFYVAAASLAGTMLAQTPALQARSFFYDDYRTVFTLDMKAIRDTGIWDEMGASFVKMLEPLIEEQFGFPLDRLDRVTSVRALQVFESGAKRFSDVTAIAGNGDLGQPREVAAGRYRSEEVGSHTLHSSQWDDGEGCVAVNEKLRIYGPAEQLRNVLAGRPRAGLPSADVMSFTAGHDGVLVYFVMDLLAEDFLREMLRDALAGVTWPENDAPTFAFGRLSATGDEDDPHVQLELVLRHRSGGEGLATTVQGVTTALDELMKMKEARLFLPVLKRIEHERDGMDAVWRVDLGRARTFGGLVGTVAPFLLFASSSGVRVLQAPAPVPVEQEIKKK